MTDRLDQLVARLAAAPLDRRLDGFEAEIGRGIARRREEARAATALAPVGIASLVLALAMGVMAGSVAAATAAAEPRPSTLSVAAHLAPSTLLEGGS